jgi:response regulator RpfG family c-di-GMP phosphodiesterase
MSPEQPAKMNVDWRNLPIGSSDLRSLEQHKSVILAADDHSLIRNLMTRLLQHEEYVVLTAADGHEALELSRQYPGTIDLLLTKT